MDVDITQLAKMMRDQRAVGGAPYVLLLGSSLSLTPEVRRAICGSDDWETFWAAVEKMSPSERRAAFKGPLERLLLAEGYRALTRLLAAGYFEVVFTLNVDDTLDDELSVLKAEEYRIWVYGEVTSAELVAALEYRSPRVKVLKLRGDVNAHKLPLTPGGQFEFPPDLEHAIRQWLSRDTIAVGDLPFDDDVWRCLRQGESALWVLELETSERLRRVKRVRKKGEVITAESFNAFFTVLADALEVEEVKLAWELPPQNPYQGLEAFTQDKARFFFGRERLTEKLLERLRRERFLAVIGASGSGKSSVVQAGLLHRLAQGALPGSVDWPTVVCRPGELVDALARLLRETPGISADEQRDLLVRVPVDKTAIDMIAERVLQGAPPDHRLVLVVDQFEELFTLESAEYREQIIAALLYAVRVAGGRTTVVVTMRADFHARAAEYDELFVWMEQHRLFVPPMGETELRDAIQRPARLVKFPLDDALTETILTDVGREPGALPLLQYALKELYDRWREGLTPAQAYQQIRGVQGALEHRANEVYNEDLNNRQQKVARHILIRLTQLGEGTEDTRRRATFEDLVTATIPLHEIEEVVDILATAQTRLLVTDDPDKERPGQTRVVEVAHEALIRGWKQLQDWLNEDRAGLLLHQRLRERTREWDAAGRHEDYLYRGLELDKAREWAEIHADDMNPLEHGFLEASVEAREARRVAARRRTQRVIAGLVTGLVIISALAIFAWGRSQLADQRRVDAENAKATAQAESTRALNAEATADARRLEAEEAQTDAEEKRLEAERQNRLALSRQLASQALQSIDAGLDPELSVLLAIEAIRATRDEDNFYTLQARDALRQALDLPLLATFRTDDIDHVVFSSDGRRLLVSGGRPAHFEVLDLVDRKGIKLDQVNEADRYIFSPDGNCLAALSAVQGKWGTNSKVSLWDLRNGKELSRFDMESHPSAQSILVSGGEYLLTEDCPSLHLYDALSGEEVATFRDNTGAAFLKNIVFSPNEKHLAVTFDIRDPDKHIIGVLDGSTLELLFKTASQTDWVEKVIFNSDGSLLAAKSIRRGDNALLPGVADTVRIWSVPDGEELSVFTYTTLINDIIFSPDGSQVAMAVSDGIIIWNALSGEEMVTLPEPDGVNVVDFSPGGNRLLTGGPGGTVRIWDIPTGETVRVLHNGYGMTKVHFRQDDSQLITIDRENIRLWDASGEPRSLVLHYDDRIWFPYGSDLDEDRLLIRGDNTAWLIDASNGDKLVTFQNIIQDIRYSRDRNRLAFASDDNTARLIDVVSGEELGTLRHDDVINDIWFSWECDIPSDTSSGKGGQMEEEKCSKYVATASADHTARLWDAFTGQELAVLQHQDMVSGTIFSQDSRYLATYGAENGARLWDTSTGQQLAVLHHDGVVKGISFSWECNDVSNIQTDQAAHEQCSSKYVATASADHTACLWDVLTGQELAVLQHDGAVKGVYFLRCSRPASSAKRPEWCGKRLLTYSNDGLAHLWAVPSGEKLASLSYEGDWFDWDYSSASSRVIAEGTEGLVLLDISSGEKLATFNNADYYSMDISPDGSRLVARSDDTAISLIDALTGKELAVLLHQDRYKNLYPQFNPDGSRLVMRNENVVHLMDGLTGQELATLYHESSVDGMVFNSDGSRLATRSGNTIHLWDGLTGQELAILTHEANVSDLLFSGECDSPSVGTDIEESKVEVKRCGGRLVTRTRDNSVHVWPVYVGDLLKSACSLLSRNLTDQEWQQYLGDLSYHKTCPNLPGPEEALTP